MEYRNRRISTQYALLLVAGCFVSQLYASSDVSKGHDNYGLLVSKKARKYAIVKELDDVVSLKDGTVVLQYEVRLQEELECGGAYLKYLRPQEAGWIPKEFSNESPFTRMFGPDISGSTLSTKHHLKFPPSVPSDKLTHVYSAVLKPDNELLIFPPLVPAETIPDPDDKKSEDWDEREKIPDPDAKKPDDWDEDSPLEIIDEDAEKPEGWLDDEPEEIDDPEATNPEDWVDEEDCEWEAPKIDNPKCEEAPAYGEWQRPLKSNQAYKGIWKPRDIPNPNYFKLRQAQLRAIAAIGIEIWTMQNGILFENIMIASDEKAAESYRTSAWKPKFDVEKEKQKVEEAATSGGLKELQLIKMVFVLPYKLADIPFLGKHKSKVLDLLDKAEKQLNLTVGIVISIIVLIFTVPLNFVFGGKQQQLAKATGQAKRRDGTEASSSNSQVIKEKKEGQNEDAAASRRRARRENEGW
ncbi:unnamed protein product [Withania somnifera]